MDNVRQFTIFVITLQPIITNQDYYYYYCYYYFYYYYLNYCLNYCLKKHNK